MELAAMGKKALLVPFPFATNDHQRANADYLAKTGQARVVLEKDLTVEGFGSILEDAFRGGPSAPGPAVENDAAARLAAMLERVARHDLEGR
jgi:UDP-N-acetylglucosamine--N-acetylmuramyl-(pentapeptide) pyrophosphoryl-undecaprenol N-acetylglucosamine transferase